MLSQCSMNRAFSCFYLGLLEWTNSGECAKFLGATRNRHSHTCCECAGYTAQVWGSVRQHTYGAWRCGSGRTELAAARNFGRHAAVKRSLHAYRTRTAAHLDGASVSRGVFAHCIRKRLVPNRHECAAGQCSHEPLWEQLGVLARISESRGSLRRHQSAGECLSELDRKS